MAYDIEKIINISRTTKVVKGGRILRFSALVVVGNRQGVIGVGMGKAREVQVAIQKAIDSARKNMFPIVLNKKNSVPHPAFASHGASQVVIMPANEGTGIIAGGAMRAIFEVAGVSNVLAKCIGSTNSSNIVWATIAALRKIKPISFYAEKRGKPISSIIEA